MKTIHLDQYTKQAAIDYANNEAELRGFEKNGPEWKKSFKKYLGFAVGTMSIGRNPRSRRNPRDVNTWPEIFSESGFAGKVKSNFKGPSKPESIEEIRERIRSAVTALTYLYLGGVYGIKTTTATHKSGKIDESQMSDLQLRSDDIGKDEANAENIDVALNQLALTIIESAAYEYLLPFFTMKPEDVKAILDKVTIDGKITASGMAEARTMMEKRIRAVIGNRLKDLSFKDLVLG